MGDNTSWADLSRDGRRLERIIKLMETKMSVPLIETSLWFAYLDRLLKCEHEKAYMAEIVLGIRRVLRKAEKITV